MLTTHNEQDFHKLVLNCLSAAGYNPSDQGTCHGYATTAILYFLLGKFEEFKEIDSIIRKNCVAPDKLLSQIKKFHESIIQGNVSEEDIHANILDSQIPFFKLRVFLQMVSVLHHPDKFNDLFKGLYIPQYQTHNVMPLFEDKNNNPNNKENENVTKKNNDTDKENINDNLIRDNLYNKKNINNKENITPNIKKTVKKNDIKQQNKQENKQENNIVMPLHYVGFYTKENLSSYLSDVIKQAEKNKKDFAFSLLSHNHTISLLYHHPKKWSLVDINGNLTEVTGDDVLEKIVTFLYDSFFEKNQKNALCFSTQIYGLHDKSLANLISDIKKQNNYNNLHQVFDNKKALHVINTKCQTNLTFLAAKFNYSDVLNSLAEYGTIDSDYADEQGCTPLYVAAQQGHKECLAILINEDAEININVKGVSPLLVAVVNNHPECVALLLQKGAKLDLPVVAQKGAKVDLPAIKQSSLWVSAKNGFTSCLKLLLQYKAKVDELHKSGATFLAIAVQNGHTDCVASLLLNKANVNFVMTQLQDHTPLMVACSSHYTIGKHELYRILLNNGADLLQKNTLGQTAFDGAIKNQHATAIIEILKYLKKNPSIVFNSTLSTESMQNLSVLGKKNKAIGTLLEKIQNKQNKYVNQSIFSKNDEVSSDSHHFKKNHN